MKYTPIISSDVRPTDVKIENYRDVYDFTISEVSD